jgi:hypothetical protein
MEKSFLPKKAILRHHPVEYMPQKKRFCGAYVLKAIFSMYGVDTKKSAEAYWPKFNQLFFGFSWPRVLHRELRKRGFTSSGHRTNRTLSVNTSLSLLKEELANNRPVIMLISNLFSKNHVYSSKRKRMRPHWVLLLGFDDAKKVFYFYDSALRKSAYQNVPIGNIAVPYGITYDSWRGEFLTAIFNFYFITLHPPE